MSRALCLFLSLLWVPSLGLAEESAEEQAEEVAEQAVDEDGSERVEYLSGYIPEEVKAFREAKERFEERVAEFEADTRAYVEAQEALYFERLTEGYDARVDELDQEGVGLREVAIERYEAFLLAYPTAPEASDVRLRLAELHRKKANDQFVADVTAHEEALTAAEEADDLDAMIELEESYPEFDYSRVVALTTRIIEDNRDLPPEERYEQLELVYYILGFCYNKDGSAQADDEKAKQAFLELTEVVPDSARADDARMILGGYYFDEGDYLSAIDQYEQVIAMGSERPRYKMAQYKLAWAYYKLDKYEEAMQLFVDLLDDSERMLREEGRRSSYESDAVDSLAKSFIDQADMQDITPKERANRFFASIGEDRSYEWRVLNELSEMLIKYARPDDALELYRYMQRVPRFMMRPENPTIQNEVVKLLTTGWDADLTEAGKERLLMTERYGEQSAWWAANRDNPEALSTARSFIEGYLANVAVQLYNSAKTAFESAEEKSAAGDIDGAMADYRESERLYTQASEKYAEYLDKYPIADGFYEKSLWKTGGYEGVVQAQRAMSELDPTLSIDIPTLLKARDGFKSLYDSRKYHPFGDLSLYSWYRRTNLLLALEGAKTSEPHPARQEESRYTTESGVEIIVYGLTPTQQELIAGADAFLAHEFTEPTRDDLKDLREPAAADVPKILLHRAQVHRWANQFEEARPDYWRIVRDYPLTDEAMIAAYDIIASYNVEGNDAEARRWSREFLTMRLGADPGQIDNVLGQIQDNLERSVYREAFKYYNESEWSKAAAGFLRFAEEFPESETAADALDAAAQSYEQLGKPMEAVAVYEKLVNQHPEFERTADVYYIIASRYEDIYRLDDAVDRYERYLELYPDGTRAADAQYQMAFLKVGLADYQGAAEAYETYARRYPEQSDAKAQRWAAGKNWERVSPERAIKFYESFLRDYPKETDFSWALQAQWNIVRMQREIGDERKIDKAERALVRMYEDGVEAGLKAASSERVNVASIAVRDLVAQAEELSTWDFPAPARSLNEVEQLGAQVAYLTVIPEKIQEFEAAYVEFNETYASPAHRHVGFVYLGEAWSHYFRRGMDITPPEGVADFVEQAMWEKLEEEVYPKVEPFADNARDWYLDALKVAEKFEVYDEWVEMANKGLNRLEPREYPAQKPETFERRELIEAADYVEVDREALEASLQPQEVEEDSENASEGQPEASETEEGSP